MKNENTIGQTFVEWIPYFEYERDNAILFLDEWKKYTIRKYPQKLLVEEEIHFHEPREGEQHHRILIMLHFQDEKGK